jgi:YbbR domain-containing protein
MFRKLGRAIFGNWHLKLMSLGLAVMSWFLVTAAGIQEVEVDGVPVEVVTPEGIALWKLSRSRLRVKLKGPRAELSAVGSRDLRARYVVANDLVVEGEKAVIVDCKEGMIFSMPLGVRVTEVEPPDIRVSLVPKIKARAQVKAFFEGNVRAGFKIASARVVPARVSVVGPEPIVKDLKEVETLPINCDGRYESFSQRVSIQNKRGEYELEIGESVEVKVRIAEQLGTRVMKGLSINLMGPSELLRDVTIVPETVDVTVKGQKQLLAVLTKGQIMPFVHVGKTGKYRLPVDVNVDLPGLRVVGDLPIVEVTVR